MPEGRWPELKWRFFEYLLQHGEEWKALKESNPLDYMPNMAIHFQKVTGLRVTGLEAYISWIKPGNYFHWMIAQKGQLSLCPHLAGHDPPRGPMMPPPWEALPMGAQEGQGATRGDARSSGRRDKPMETSGAGDGITWGDQMDAAEWAGRARKCHRSHSRR